MDRRQPISTRTDTRFPYTTLVRSPRPARWPSRHSRPPAGTPPPARGRSPRARSGRGAGGAVRRRRPRPRRDCSSGLSRRGRHGDRRVELLAEGGRSEEHTSELQSLMRISYAVFCLKKKKSKTDDEHVTIILKTQTK